MSGRDESQFNQYQKADFAILRSSHGGTADTSFQAFYRQAWADQMPVGVYHVPELDDPEIEADSFWRIIGSGTLPFHRGLWLDFAVGDLPFTPTTNFVDRFRARLMSHGVTDAGLYVNGAALELIPEYKRFERLWYAGAAPPARWLMWQNGALDHGVDIDIAGDVGGVVNPFWRDYNWPNL